MIFDKMLYRIVPEYIKKEPYTGSFAGKRFRIWTKLHKDENEENEIRIIHTCIYPDEFCYEKTSEDKKVNNTFEFSEKGLQEATDYIETELCKINN